MIWLIISLVVLFLSSQIVFFVFLNNFFKRQKLVVVKENIKIQNMEISVRDGMKSAIKELEYEKEQQELIKKHLRDTIQPDKQIFIPGENDDPIRSGGELIPFNLSDGEKDLLRQFYND